MSWSDGHSPPSGFQKRPLVPQGALIARKPVPSRVLHNDEANISSVNPPRRDHWDPSVRPDFVLQSLDESFHAKTSLLPFPVEGDINAANSVEGYNDKSLNPPKDSAVSSAGDDIRNHRQDWLPYSLSWPYLLVLILVSVALAVTTLILTWYSATNKGLGSDTKSTILLFGWRFSPTLVAVVYVLLESNLLNDVRRTEVFARLSYAESLPASCTLLRPKGSWWNDPGNALRKKENGGRRSWTLFWASLANIVGMLVISPLSAGLLSTQNMQIINSATFSQTPAFQKAPLNTSADDSTFVRTIASTTLGLKTSAWLSDEYAILPFWPTLQKVPLGVSLATTPQTWKGVTTVFQSQLICDPMWLTEAGYVPLVDPAPQGGVDWNSIQLTSADGCVYDLAIHDDSLFNSGGGWWSRSSGSNFPSAQNAEDCTLNPETCVVVEASQQCDNRELFFVTTAYQKSSTRATGHVCTTHYFQAEVEATAEITSSASNVNFNTGLFEKKKHFINTTLVDINYFEELFLSWTWNTKFQLSSRTTRPEIGGPLLPIAALYNFDLNKILASTSLLHEAQAVKQRFFGEALQSTFSTLGSRDAPQINGEISYVEQRIVVNFAIGIVLAVLLLWSAIMFTAVYFQSRSHKRPLHLSRDPASIAALSSLISNQNDTRVCFEGSDRLSKSSLKALLVNKRFSLQHSGLHSDSQATRHGLEQGTHMEKRHGDWRPTVLHGWSGVSALVFFAALIAGIAALFAESRKSPLYQTIFVYQTSVSFGHGITANVGAYSIIPTLLAVLVKLWWVALESAFKRLQPYVTMARAATRSSKGLTLSYADSVMLWVSWKAASNKHWLLALITLGTFLVEVFTVSMSALWDRTSGGHMHNVTLPRSFELRSIPQVFTSLPTLDPDEGDIVADTVTAQLFGSVLNGWLYSGLIDMAYDGSSANWSSPDLEGWAFAPVDLSNIPVPSVQRVGSSSSTDDEPTANTNLLSNLTVDSPAMRGRIDCTEIDLTNTSLWLQTIDFTNHSFWNESTLAAGLKTGYFLDNGQGKNSFTINFDPEEPASGQDTTTFFVQEHELACCANGTDNDPGRSVIGYWSVNNDESYPSVNFTVKWIVGKPFGGLVSTLSNVSVGLFDGNALFVWSEPPQMTALNCRPIFETATADVTVGLANSEVQGYSLTSEAANSTAAWSDPWLGHTNLTAECISVYHNECAGETDLPENITVSYGWLFIQALLTAADPVDIGASGGVGLLSPDPQDPTVRTFNFQTTGVNMDFMSYSAYALVEKDPLALLDPGRLHAVSNEVFSTFFQHFVADNVTVDDGSYGFQSINATLPFGLGPIANEYDNGTAAYQDRNDAHHLSPTINAKMQIGIEELHMSPTAVYICLVILAFLAATTIWIYTRHQQYFEALPRDVDSLASVLGFVYGSPRLLEWVEEHKHEKDWGVKEGGREPVARMGWSESSRWGIELLDTNDVDNLDASNLYERTKYHSGSSSSREEREGLAMDLSPDWRDR